MLVPTYEFVHIKTKEQFAAKIKNTTIISFLFKKIISLCRWFFEINNSNLSMTSKFFGLSKSSVINVFELVLDETIILSYFSPYKSHVTFLLQV